MLVSNIRPTTQFKSMNLPVAQIPEANKLIRDYATKVSEKETVIAKNKIFKFFDKYLKSFAKEKMKDYRDIRIVLQRIYLLFFEALEKFKNDGQPLEKILQSVDSFKNNSDDSTAYISLGRIPAKSLMRELDFFLTEEKTIETISGNYDNQLVATEKINHLLSTSEIEEKNIIALQKRAKGLKYREIGKDLGISRVAAREKVLNTIAEIQKKQNIGTIDYKALAQALIERLGLNKSIEKVESIIIKNICLREKDIDFLDNNSAAIAKELRLPKEIFTNSVISHAQVLLMKPETILNNIRTSSSLLGIEPDAFINAALKQPALFYLSPKTIKSNVVTASKLMGVSEHDYIQAALKNQTMFYQKPETIARKSDIIAYYKKIQKQPVNKTKSIVLKSDERLFSNILKYYIAKQTGTKFEYNYNPADLVEYLKNNADSILKIKLVPDKVVEDFITYATELAKKICGKNIFEFVL